MGPGILLDKSTVESLSREATHVQSAYFYTTVAPVLVWEICGDIEKMKQGLTIEPKVRALASKAKPFDSIVTTEWRKLCLAELLMMTRINMGNGGRRPIVDGGHRVPTENGMASIIEVQPEADALLRWSYGAWTKDHEKYGELWRRLSKSLDLVAFRHRFGPAKACGSSIEEVMRIAEAALRDPSLQFYLLDLVLAEMWGAQSAAQRARTQWSGSAVQNWRVQCPYAAYCAKTLLTFYLALSSGVIDTEPTNRVDLEYLFYLPFAKIFVSGDKRTHGRLAPTLIASDQQYVEAQRFREALMQVVEIKNAAQDDRVAARNIDLPDDSLINELWLKAWGKKPLKQNEQAKPTHQERVPTAANLSQKLDDVMKVIEASRDRYPLRRAWPGY